MKKKITLLTLCAMLFALRFSASAQQVKKVPRIGYLSAQEPARESTRSEAIRLALRERGYVEEQNIAIEYRYAEGKRDRLPELAAELVRLKVEIIVVAGGAGHSLLSLTMGQESAREVPIDQTKSQKSR